MENNFLKIPILNCPLFSYGLGQNMIFDGNFFGADLATDAIRYVTWGDLTRLNLLIPLNEIRARGINCTAEQYNYLNRGWGMALKKFGKNTGNPKHILSFGKILPFS